MTTILAPMCYFCQHQHGDFKTCDAYPEGIPDGILDNTIDHRKPWTNDDGIQFAPKSAQADQDVTDRWNLIHR